MWLMITVVNIQNSDGISKKIISQASSLAKHNGCLLLCYYENVPSILVVNEDRTFHLVKHLDNNPIQEEHRWSYYLQCKYLIRHLSYVCDTYRVTNCYIRHMFPSWKLIKELYNLKKRKIKVVYEIPTFPYYSEQMSESHNKFITIVRLADESFFWPLIYSMIDQLAVIRCREKSLRLKKMVDIKNGCSVNEISNELPDFYSNTFVLIGVGTIYKYHGYERIVDAIILSKGKTNSGKSIKFYIVGESDEIIRLRESIKNTDYCECFVFCGKQYGTDLANLYKKAHIAIGTLSLNLRRANIDTALKNIEYIAHNKPIITSGNIFDIDESSGLYLNIGTNDTIDINVLEHFSEQYYSVDTYKYRKKIIEEFSWDEIMNVFQNKSVAN